MRFSRVTALGFGSACALLGCVAGEGASTVGSTEEALTRAGCPNLMPVSTYNYDPPHAYPGTCEQANPEQDGAFDEMMGHCRQYCGQSNEQCGRGAQLANVHCVDRDIGHRWEATCVCGSATPEPGPWGGGGPLAPSPYPYPSYPSGGFGFGGAQGPFPGFPGPGPFEPSWQNGQPGWAQGPWTGPGWQPPSGWWDAPHGFQGLPPGAPETGINNGYIP
jgi:hypothetical protein